MLYWSKTKTLTNPQIYPRSLLESFFVSGLPADAASSMSSSRSKPTRAIPLRTPIVAGTPPFSRTIDSSRKARAAFSGYGKPVLRVRRNWLYWWTLSTVSVDSRF